MGGRASRDKGNRMERAIVNALQKAGFAAERIPLSGASGGSFAGDITVPVMGRNWTIEAKARSHGFAQIYEWLGDNDALIVKADRKEPLVVLSLRQATELLKRAELHRSNAQILAETMRLKAEVS